MIEVTKSKLDAAEVAIRGELPERPTADDENSIMVGKIGNSDLMDIIRGALGSLDEQKSGDKRIATGVVMAYIMAIGIRVGLQIAESEELEKML